MNMANIVWLPDPGRHQIPFLKTGMKFQLDLQLRHKQPHQE
jgi:hypothetical protein